MLTILAFSFLLASGVDAKRLPVYQRTLANYAEDGSYMEPAFAKYDNLGNQYISGIFFGTYDLCPGEDVQFFTSQDINYETPDTFFTKLSADGKCEWVRVFGDGVDIHYFYDIYFDSANNMYLSSIFSGTNDIDISSREDIQTATGSSDAVLTKYNADGEYVWSKILTGSGSGYFWNIAIDNQSNIYFTGNFSGTNDFDLGSGVDEHTANGQYDNFVTKLTREGEYIWTKIISGTAREYIESFAFDPGSQNFYLSGGFEGTVDFDPGSGVDSRTSAGLNDHFLTKIGTDGSYVWTRTFGGTSNEWAAGPVVDGEGNVYIDGYFYGTVDFDPGPGVDNHTMAGNRPSNVARDAYISKYSPNGDYIWTKTFGGVNYEYVDGIDIIHNDKIVVYGSFTLETDFDPGPGVASRTETSGDGNGSTFIAIYNKDGGFEWVHTTDGDYSFGLSTEVYGNTLAVFSLVMGEMDFDPYGNHDIVYSGSGYGVYAISYFTFSQDTTDVGQTPRSQDPNARPDFVKPITAGPNHVGVNNWVVGSESSNVAKAYLGNDVYKDDVNLTISSASQLDLQNTKPKRIPFPWEQGLNTASDIFWNFNITSAFNGYPIPKLSKPGNLVLTYDPSKLYGKSPTALKIAYFNQTKNKWTTLTTKPTLDTSTHTISTQFTLPGYYSVVYGR